MPIIFDQQVINGTVNAASVTYSTQLPDHSKYSFEVTFSGTGIKGLVKLQASNSNSTFVDLADSEKPILQDSGTFFFDVEEASYQHVKLVCQSISGDILFVARLVIKKDSKIF